VVCGQIPAHDLECLMGTQPCPFDYTWLRLPLCYITAKLSSGSKDEWFSKPKIFTIWFFRVGQPLNLNVCCINILIMY